MEAPEITAIPDTETRRDIFIPRDVASVFRAGFLDEDACRQWILGTIHGTASVHCPGCQAELEGRALQRFWEGTRVCCRHCRKFFTALTGTFLAGCHMSYSEVILLAVFLHFGIHHREIARILNVSPETVRLWDVKFRAQGKIRNTYMKKSEMPTGNERK